jgi:membrane-associated phospholipid phosphatase
LNFYFFNKLNKESLKKLKDIALFGLIVSGASLVFTEALKLTWGRVRFRDLSSDYREFTNLFTINGYNGNKSFPSGHSAYSMFAIFIFPILVDNKSKKYESILFICGVIWWILTAYSRITIGAHYLTDVCFGGLITLISYVIITLILKKKIKSN